MANDVKVSGGIGFAGLLAIVFIVLKLTKVITWSWWWVTCPLWLPWALAIVVAVIYFIFLLIKER
jgi:hypothetical protein